MKKHITVILFFSCITFLSSFAQSPSGSAVRFVENKRQWDSTVLYRTDLPGGKLFAGRTKLTYVFYDTKILAAVHDKNHHPVAPAARVIGETSEEEPMMKLHAFSVTFAGANPTCPVFPEFRNPENNNFYIGSDSSKWASNVASYGKIQYKNIYTSTDLSLYEHDQSLKYEFVVHPGGDPSAIKLQYKGAEKLYLKNGALHIQTSVNEIIEDAPYIYQKINGKEIKIAGEFHLIDSVVTFILTERYNKRFPLVIDPKLIFSTYSGSVADNWGNTGAFDDAGNMYSGGTVFGVGFPTTTGAYQQSFGGSGLYGFGIDVGILKYNASGTGLLYATYIGGSRTEVPYSLVVNQSDELVVFGTTSSINFPIRSSSYDKTFNGGVNVEPISGIVFSNGSDLFIAKLSSNGSALLGSTYVGGSNNDGILYQFEGLTKNYGDQLRGDVTTDDQNNIYVASNTRSSNFPLTAGALQTTLASGGAKDACVFKFDSNLSSLLWSTYLGGGGEDAAYSIQVDSLYNVFVAGGTASSNFPTTSGVLHPSSMGGIDGFVTHINSTGTAILNSTYLGTSAYDQAYFVQLDTAENVYVLGQTRGAYPVTAGAYNNPNSGQFIHKLNRTLSASLMSTVVGTGGLNPNISLTAFLVNNCGNIFLSGWGGSSNPATGGFVGGTTTGLPVTPDAFQSTTDGSDFYIMVLAQDGATLLYATFLGGSGLSEHVDGGTSRFDKKGIIYEAVCAGCGGSSDFPTTPGAWSNTNKSNFLYDDGYYYSNCNNGAFKFDLVSLKADFVIGKSLNCADNKVTLLNRSLGGRSFEWDLGDGTTNTSAGPVTHTYASPGTYTIRLIATDLTTCIGKDTMIKELFIPVAPVITINTVDTTICREDSVQLLASYNPYYTYSWSPAEALTSTTIYNPIALPIARTVYTVVATDTNGCTVSRNLTVSIVDLDRRTSVENDADCEGRLHVKLKNSTRGNVLFNWFFGDGHSYSGKEKDIGYDYEAPGTYTVSLTIESNGCSFQDSVRFTMDKVVIPNLVTPNGDGLNDVYEIQGSGSNWTFEVYNRWGKALYKNSNYNDEWSGEDLSDGVYYFLIVSPNEKRCRGWVQILR